ncbi:MAG: helix-turn-helix domain-containing protein [Planctomycetia bacterium]|nr:helix-turn-helix domain-containing protein [Planctomycetia bacterium]
MARSDTRTISELLIEWQSIGDPHDFESLVGAIRPIIETQAAAILRRSGFRSSAAVDDVVSLVLDHLRRLHPAQDLETPVTPFAPRSKHGDDDGRRYVLWLTRGRACDVLRRERRRVRRSPTFTDLLVRQRRDLAQQVSTLGILAPAVAVQRGDKTADGGPTAKQISSFRSLIHSLPYDDRRVVEMLLAGRPQKVIAESLGISAGTVSRRKVHALAKLRRHLQVDRRHGGDRPDARPDRQPLACHPADAAGFGRDAPPFMVFSTTASQPADIRRASDWHLFGVVTKGVVRSIWLSAPGRPEAFARDGACAYFPPSDTNRFRWEPREPTTVLQVMMAPDYVQMVADTEEQRLSGELCGRHCFEDAGLAALLRRFGGQTGESADVLMAELNGHAVVMRLLELQGCGRPGWQFDPARFTRAEMRSLCDYVEGNLGTTFQLHSLAGLVGLSPGNFARKFRLSFGICPAAFVRARRVREAARLLQADDVSVAEIALRIGFSSQSHFAQVFRSIVGTSPSEFRAECS